MEFWFEFASTYSYVAAGRIEALARAAGAEIAWRPFLLGPIFQKQGWSDSPFNLYAAKGAYMWRDMERLCQGYGLPFKRPSVFPRNSVRAARVALLGAEAATIVH
jgi:2-hydroxychromene-2-carboxylate isomerase